MPFFCLRIMMLSSFTQCVYTVSPQPEVENNETLLSACADLFSNHYGVWGSHHPKHGQRVTLTSKKLKSDYLFNKKTCFLVTASYHNQLIGHVFYCRFFFPPRQGYISWITQMVVGGGKTYNLKKPLSKSFLPSKKKEKKNRAS